MTQTQQIREHLESGRSITQRQAAQLYNIWRLSARIKDLRDMGLDIQTEMVTRRGKTFGRYHARLH